MKGRSVVSLLLFLVTLMTNFLALAHADEAITLAKGQILYVPAYSHIYAGNSELPLLLTVTLSIRNVDLRQSITVTAVDYYGTKGEILRKYLNKNVILGPLESIRYVIPYKDKAGGSGANFVVVWKSEKPVNLPIVECVMIGAERQQGISFTSRGQAITE